MEDQNQLDSEKFNLRYFLSQPVSSVWAYAIIILFGIACALACYHAGQSYYQEKTAMYESQAAAAQLELKTIKK